MVQFSEKILQGGSPKNDKNGCVFQKCILQSLPSPRILQALRLSLFLDALEATQSVREAPLQSMPKVFGH